MVKFDHCITLTIGVDTIFQARRLKPTYVQTNILFADVLASLKMGMPLSHSLTRALQSHTLGIAESVRNCFKTSAPSVHMVVMYYIWYWLDLIELDWFKIIQFCSNRPVQSWLFLYLFGMLLHVPIWYKLHINQYQQRKSWLFKVCLLPKLFLMTVQPWQKWSFSLNFAFICSCLLLHTL